MAHSPYRKCHYCKATDQQFIKRRGFERRAWTLFKNSGRMCCPNCQRKGREDERLATVQRIRTIQKRKAFTNYLMEMEAQYTTSVLGEPVEPYGAPTAALKQYDRIKATYPDAVLLFRDGDRYQSFGPDADTCYQVLGLVRTEILPSGLPMAWFPFQALEDYLPRLVKAGYRVAICDQLEAPPASGYAELQPDCGLFSEPTVQYTYGAKPVKGTQIIPPIDEDDRTKGDVAWPVKAWEVFRFLGERYYLVRNHTSEREKPRDWCVVHECGMGIGYTIDARKEKAVELATEAIVKAYEKLGDAKFREAIAKGKERRRRAAHPLPAVYLEPGTLSVAAEPDMWELPADEPVKPTPQMEQTKAQLKVLGKIIRVDLWAFVDKIVLAISNEVVLDLIALDEHFGKHDPDYDPREATYKGKPSSMKDYVQQRYGDAAVDLFLTLLNHKQAA